MSYDYLAEEERLRQLNARINAKQTEVQINRPESARSSNNNEDLQTFVTEPSANHWDPPSTFYGI